MTKTLKIFILVGATALLGIGLAAGLYWKHLSHFAMEPGPSQATTEIEIVAGTSPKQIARILEKHGVVTSDRDFYHYLRFVSQSAARLQAGDYEFTPGQTPAQIIIMLQKGRTKEFRFTIPEGSSKHDIAQIIESAGLGHKEAVLAAMDDPALITSFEVPSGVSGGVEGYLFPDTYQFRKKTDPKVMLVKMKSRLDQVLTDQMRTRMAEEGLSLHKVLTLASIVEKETGDPKERPLIASVFFNRLTHKMKLQTDPTVIYSIPDYHGNIAKTDLKLQNPYNTYVHEGLPPGPIASPGLEAIKAVLWPAQSNYLYFVSRNDHTHEFCPDYKCHQKMVKKWQIDFFRK